MKYIRDYSNVLYLCLDTLYSNRTIHMKIQICTECCIDLTVHPMSKNSWRADFLVGSTTCTLGFWLTTAMLYNKRCWGLITAGKWQPDCRWGCSMLWGRGCCETSLQYRDDRHKLLSFWSFLTERKARKFPTAKHFGASHNELLIFHLHPNGNLKHIVPMTKEVQSRKSAICGHDYKGKKNVFWNTNKDLAPIWVTRTTQYYWKKTAGESPLAQYQRVSTNKSSEHRTVREEK